MTPDEFISRLFTDVMRAAAEEADFFADPPGRSPAPDYMAVAELIQGLDTEQRRVLESLLQLVAGRTLMNVLYTLDGVHPILDMPNAHIELAVVEPDGRSEMLPADAPGELGDIARALETTRRGL